MKIKCNNIIGRRQGEVVDVKDSNGVPMDIYWRRRLVDALDDGCCEIVTPNVMADPLNLIIETEVEENDDNI